MVIVSAKIEENFCSSIFVHSVSMGEMIKVVIMEKNWRIRSFRMQYISF